MSNHSQRYHSEQPNKEYYICLVSDSRNFFGPNDCVVSRLSNSFIFCRDPCEHVLQPNQITIMYSENGNDIVSTSIISSYFFTLFPLSRAIFDFSNLSGRFRINLNYIDDSNYFVKKISSKRCADGFTSCVTEADNLYQYNQTIFITISADEVDDTIGGNFSTSSMTSLVFPSSSSPSPISYGRSPIVRRSFISLLDVFPSSMPAFSATPTILSSSQIVVAPTTGAQAGKNLTSNNSGTSASVAQSIVLLVSVMVFLLLLMSFLAIVVFYCRKLMRLDDYGEAAAILMRMELAAAAPMVYTVHTCIDR
jgi:hypothetical protein